MQTHWSQRAAPGPTRDYRESYRRSEIPAGYDGRRHLAFTFGVGSLALAACLAQLEAVRPVEWLTVPLAFLYANLAEYLGHRYPMHRPYPGLGLIYRRHAGQHHRFFRHDAMALESLRDLRAVLFPPNLMLFFFAGFGLPMWLVLEWLVSPNVAWLMLAVAIAYFLHYEFLHLAYHLPATHPIARLSLVRRLAWLHRTHHDPALMTRANFNITWPVCDRLFGTLVQARGPDDGASS
jgi:hypothetical protein